MKAYRCYLVDAGTRTTDVKACECKVEESAIRWADMLFERSLTLAAIELWSDSALIYRRERMPGAALFPRPATRPDSFCGRWTN